MQSCWPGLEAYISTHNSFYLDIKLNLHIWIIYWSHHGLHTIFAFMWVWGWDGLRSVNFETFAQILSSVAWGIGAWGNRILDRSGNLYKIHNLLCLVSVWTYMCGLSFDYAIILQTVFACVYYFTNYICIHVGTGMRHRLERVFRFWKIYNI